MSTSHQPSNFSWVSDSVAGFAFPYEKSEVEYLANVAKITHIITMCYEIPEYISNYPSLIHHHLPVEDLTAASIPVINKAVEIIKNAEACNQKVGVHCQLGRGRAGTILACYLAYKNNLDGDTAIRELRRLRPKSIDSEQEEAVRKFAKFIKKS